MRHEFKFWVFYSFNPKKEKEILSQCETFVKRCSFFSGPKLEQYETTWHQFQKFKYLVWKTPTWYCFLLFISEAPTKIVVQRVGDKVPEADSGEVVAAAGEDLELECISTGANPAPVLKWYMITRAGQMEEVAGAKHSQVKKNPRYLWQLFHSRIWYEMTWIFQNTQILDNWIEGCQVRNLGTRLWLFSFFNPACYF